MGELIELIVVRNAGPFESNTFVEKNWVQKQVSRTATKFSGDFSLLSSSFFFLHFIILSDFAAISLNLNFDSLVCLKTSTCTVLTKACCSINSVHRDMHRLGHRLKAKV